MVKSVANYNDFITKLRDAGEKLVVIYFYENTLFPISFCKEIECMESSKNDVIFLKVNIKDCDDVAKLNNIYAVPAFVLMKKKTRLDKTMRVNKLQSLIEKYTI